MWIHGRIKSCLQHNTIEFEIGLMKRIVRLIWKCRKTPILFAGVNCRIFIIPGTNVITNVERIFKDNRFTSRRNPCNSRHLRTYGRKHIIQSAI
jgi:hypothetical protein